MSNRQRSSQFQPVKPYQGTTGPTKVKVEAQERADSPVTPDSTTEPPPQPVRPFSVGDDVFYKDDSGQNVFGSVTQVNSTMCLISFGDGSSSWASFKRLKKLGVSLDNNGDGGNPRKKAKMEQTQSELTCMSCGCKKKVHSKKAGSFSLSNPYHCRRCTNAAIERSTTNGAYCLNVHSDKLFSGSNSPTSSQNPLISRDNRLVCFHCNYTVKFNNYVACKMCQRPCHTSCMGIHPKPLVGDQFWDIMCVCCGTQESPTSSRNKVFSVRRSINNWSDVGHLILSCLSHERKGKSFFDLDGDILPYLEAHCHQLHLPRSYKTMALKERRIFLSSSLTNAKLRFQNGAEVRKEGSMWAIRSRHNNLGCFQSITPPTPPKNNVQNTKKQVVSIQNSRTQQDTTSRTSGIVHKKMENTGPSLTPAKNLAVLSPPRKPQPVLTKRSPAPEKATNSVSPSPSHNTRPDTSGSSSRIMGYSPTKVSPLRLTPPDTSSLMRHRDNNSASSVKLLTMDQSFSSSQVSEDKMKMKICKTVPYASQPQGTARTPTHTIDEGGCCRKSGSQELIRGSPNMSKSKSDSEDFENETRDTRVIAKTSVPVKKSKFPRAAKTQPQPHSNGTPVSGLEGQNSQNRVLPIKVKMVMASNGNKVLPKKLGRPLKTIKKTTDVEQVKESVEEVNDADLELHNKQRRKLLMRAKARKRQHTETEKTDTTSQLPASGIIENTDIPRSLSILEWAQKNTGTRIHCLPDIPRAASNIELQNQAFSYLRNELPPVRGGPRNIDDIDTYKITAVRTDANGNKYYLCDWSYEDEEGNENDTEDGFPCAPSNATSTNDSIDELPNELPANVQVIKQEPTTPPAKIRSTERSFQNGSGCTTRNGTVNYPDVIDLTDSP